MQQFLHRGSVLENTENVLAFVLYTGAETKLIMNQGKYNFKRSRSERNLNLIMLVNLFISILLVVSGAMMNYFFTLEHYKEHTYIFTGIEDD